MKLTDRIFLCGSGAFGLTPLGDCHCYVLNGGSELALIDCGLQKNPQAILDCMTADGLEVQRLRWVLLTHTHPDHANGCAWLKENKDVCIAASKFEAAALEHGLPEILNLTSEPDGYEQYANIPRVRSDRILQDGDRIRVGDLEVTALETPGHTAGSMCYQIDTSTGRQLFSGDEVFYHGFVSVLTPPLSCYDQYPAGLGRLKNLHIDGLFPAHLMWTLQNGQSHIDKAISAFEKDQRPVLKPFS